METSSPLAKSGGSLQKGGHDEEKCGGVFNLQLVII